MQRRSCVVSPVPGPPRPCLGFVVWEINSESKKVNPLSFKPWCLSRDFLVLH